VAPRPGGEDGPELVSVLAPNPSVFTGPGTNTYVVGGGEHVVVIDPGSDDNGHLAAVGDAARRMGTPATVVITHHHADHTDGAVRLAAELGVPLAGRPHPDAPAYDAALDDGDEVAAGAGVLRVVSTPGHTSEHIALHWLPAGVLFAGDLVAGEGFIVIDPPDGNLAAYLDSLARARDLGSVEVRPAHGPAISDPAAYLDGYIRHRLEREARVLDALSPDVERRLDELLPVAYADTPVAMHPIAARSLLAHLEKLVADGRAARAGREPIDEDAFRRT
jgi:glyoxylase-like metal-dependent hydrolase (beta-lactamase superfamily II)